MAAGCRSETRKVSQFLYLVQKTQNNVEQSTYFSAHNSARFQIRGTLVVNTVSVRKVPTTPSPRFALSLFNASSQFIQLNLRSLVGLTPGWVHYIALTSCFCRSHWPLGLRRRSTAACLLRSWVRNPPGAWMSVCCDCCVLSGRGRCDGLITRLEESYRLWCVVV